MRYLGIDYGKKRVGIALSDADGQFSMAYTVLQNDGRVSSNVGSNLGGKVGVVRSVGKGVSDKMAALIAKIAEICVEQEVGEIVLGESRDYKNKPNAIMVEVMKFKAELERILRLPVHLEPEFMTSSEAGHLVATLEGDPKGLDASAAALILKSYLDKRSSAAQKSI